ncbi:Protein of unknown function [Lactobacillus helveticus CIRM-BIA 104]|uniref:Uncharacterized protein n=1 Tax=Lactobacillus helveticus CIRM-BIA 104 TaxID=1226333 RepID=U6F6R1_LACHE|nr:Protein of unknown function [Lactobacillus helveticus CIRM-BIA 104]
MHKKLKKTLLTVYQL